MMFDCVNFIVIVIYWCSRYIGLKFEGLIHCVVSPHVKGLLSKILDSTVAPKCSSSCVGLINTPDKRKLGHIPEARPGEGELTN